MLKRTFILTTFILGMSLVSKAEVEPNRKPNKEKQASETTKIPEKKKNNVH